MPKVLNYMNSTDRGMAHRIKELYLCIKTGKVVVINWNVLDSVGPMHDVDGIE